MLPIHKIIWYEWCEKNNPERIPEPEAMEDPEQIRAYIRAYEWGGPTSALQLYHMKQLATLIRPGDTVLDLACGPGPLLIELAPLYPGCRFIGMDLSQPMLAMLREGAIERNIHNIEILCEDICEMSSVPDKSVDVIITTSALHHLPDVDALERLFGRIEEVLKTDGGLYAFDFGLLKSKRTRDLLVADLGRKAPPVTANDYANSLRAAFPIEDVVSLARRKLKRTIEPRSSALVDFYYFLRTPRRGNPAAVVINYIRVASSRLGVESRIEHGMLTLLQRSR